MMQITDGRWRKPSSGHDRVSKIRIGSRSCIFLGPTSIGKTELARAVLERTPAVRPSPIVCNIEHPQHNLIVIVLVMGPLAEHRLRLHGIFRGYLDRAEWAVHLGRM
jgi:hypothetical protein